MLQGEKMRYVEEKIRTLAELQGRVSEMQAKGYELEKIEGNDIQGFYAVFVKVEQ